MSGKDMYVSVIDTYVSCLIQPDDHGWVPLLRDFLSDQD